MKKLSLVLASIMLSIILSAQVTPLDKSKIETLNDKPSSYDTKSSWVGGGFESYYTGAVMGDEFYIAGSEFSQIEEGDQITKVKFYHLLGIETFESGTVEFTNTEYTIKIYENPTLGGPYTSFGFYSTDIGTPVYTETVTLGVPESDQMYEFTLATPYTVNSNDYWIAVCFDNGKGAMRLGAADPSYEGQYYMYWDGSAYGAGTVIGKPNFGTMSVPEFHTIGISLYVDDGNPYEEQSDLTIKYLDTYPSPTVYISETSITDVEDLIIYPAIFNNGLEATSNSATISVTVDGAPFGSDTPIDLSGGSALPSGYYTTVFPSGSLTITASEMDLLGLSGMFDVCFNITYDGVDPVVANNTVCLTVTRGDIAITDCDMEAMFIISNENETPIAASTSITAAEDLLVFPAVKNNGPDDANNTANIVISVSGTEVDNNDANLDGLLSTEIMPVSESGYTLSAAVMDLAGLTGTFDICMTVTYEGNDTNADNDEICLTVNRAPVSVESTFESNISVFPNPANNVIAVANAENANITIINMLGAVVSTVENATTNQTIDISELADGTYFVRVNSEVFKINVVK